jgi:hypothetical protein
MLSSPAIGPPCPFEQWLSGMYKQSRAYHGIVHKRSAKILRCDAPVRQLSPQEFLVGLDCRDRYRSLCTAGWTLFCKTPGCGALCIIELTNPNQRVQVIPNSILQEFDFECAQCRKTHNYTRSDVALNSLPSSIQ